MAKLEEAIREVDRISAKIRKRGITGLQNQLMRRIDNEGLHYLGAEELASKLTGNYEVGGMKIIIGKEYLEQAFKRYTLKSFEEADEQTRSDMTDFIKYRYEKRKEKNKNLDLTPTIKDMARTLRVQNETGIHSADEELIRYILREDSEEENLLEITYFQTYPVLKRKEFAHHIAEKTRFGISKGVKYATQRAYEYWDSHQKPSLFKRIIRRLKAA